MEAMGLELKQDEEPIFGSWFKEVWFKFWGGATSEDAKQVYQEGADALRAHVEGSTVPEQSAKLMAAAGDLIRSLEDIPNAAVRLGNAMLLKQTINSEPQIWIETVSPAIMRELERQPLTMRHPESVMSFIEERRAAADRALGDGQAQDTEDLGEVEPQPREKGGAPSVGA
jgi:hypothetical protein